MFLKCSHYSNMNTDKGNITFKPSVSSKETYDNLKTIVGFSGTIQKKGERVMTFYLTADPKASFRRTGNQPIATLQEDGQCWADQGLHPMRPIKVDNVFTPTGLDNPRTSQRKSILETKPIGNRFLELWL